MSARTASGSLHAVAAMHSAAVSYTHLDIEAEDRLRRLECLVGVLRDLHAAGLAAATGLHPVSYTHLYTVHGPLFFGSSNDLVEQFSYTEDPAQVVVDFSEAQIWDASTVAVLDSIREKYTEQHIEIAFVGLDARSTDFHARLSGTLNP